MALGSTDERHLLRTIELAASARAAGNHPFGSLIVDASGKSVLEAENTVVTGRDVTGHAELNVVRAASIELGDAVLQGATLYTSTEPCAMCAGAIYWAGITRVVYALGSDMLGGDRRGSARRSDAAALVSRGLRARWATGRGQRPAPRGAGISGSRRLLGLRRSLAAAARTRGAASHALRRRRMLLEQRGRPHGPPREVAAAVRAAAAEHALGAVGAERALERADAGEVALRRQVTVAALAVRAQLEHGAKPIAPDDLGSAGAGAGVPPGPTRCWSTAPLLELEAVRRRVGAHERERRLHDRAGVRAGGDALRIEARLRPGERRLQRRRDERGDLVRDARRGALGSRARASASRRRRPPRS